jgi:hypothetical protein
MELGLLYYNGANLSIFPFSAGAFLTALCGLRTVWLYPLVFMYNLCHISAECFKKIPYRDFTLFNTTIVPAER